MFERPGHSLESISLLVDDLARDAARAHAVLTGDTLFVGDVGRPDLRASLGWSAEELGSMLYDSLRYKLLTLPTRRSCLRPTAAGTLCGRNLGAETVSTIGEQRVDKDGPKLGSPAPRDALLSRDMSTRCCASRSARCTSGCTPCGPPNSAAGRSV